LRKMPGTASPQRAQPHPAQSGRSWSHVPCQSSEQALLLFCPVPSQSIADEAAWRLLAQLCQTSFYQRMRVELQLGYAVFSGLRQMAGRTGLVFGVQSPQAPLADILGHVQTFIETLPTLIDTLKPAALDTQREELASRHERSQMDLLPLAELLWQACQAGHGADYLSALQRAVRELRPDDLHHAAQQLASGTGGWLCLATGPALEPSWVPAQRSLPGR